LRIVETDGTACLRTCVSTAEQLDMGMPREKDISILVYYDTGGRNGYNCQIGRR